MSTEEVGLELPGCSALSLWLRFFPLLYFANTKLIFHFVVRKPLLLLRLLLSCPCLFMAGCEKRDALCGSWCKTEVSQMPLCMSHCPELGWQAHLPGHLFIQVAARSNSHLKGHYVCRIEPRLYVGKDWSRPGRRLEQKWKIQQKIDIEQFSRKW